MYQHPTTGHLPRRLLLRRGLYWLAALPCAGIAIGAIAYCRTSYSALCAWYLRLNPCIYKAADWQRDYFTPAVKVAGNGYAVGGAVIALAVAAYFIRRAFRLEERAAATPVHIARQDVIALALLYVFSAAIWLWGAGAPPSYDEVFSLMDCARLHPLQTASYYMRPNNHILFNLLNAAPARLFANGVLTGRIISGLSGATLLAFLYFYLRRLTESRLIAAVCCATMMLQFVVWAFSVQARGYALLLLASWGAFISLDRYLRQDDKRALALHGLCIIAGCWAVPAFMFWEAALLGWAALHFIRERRVRWKFVRMQLLTGALLYLAYLPALLFTGRHWLSGNGYVVSFGDPLPVFLLDAWHGWRGLMQYAFSSLPTEGSNTDLLLLFLPVTVYPFVRRRKGAALLLFYSIACCAFWLVELKLRRFPPYRSLIAQQSLTLAAALMAVWLLLGEAFKAKPALRKGVMVLCCAALSLFFIRYNRDNLDTGMYGYSLQGAWNNSAGLIERLPPGTSLATSAESFYPRYVCRLRGIPASDCAGSAATMYLKRNDDPTPAEYSRKLFKVDINDDYELYRIGK